MRAEVDKLRRSAGLLTFVRFRYGDRSRISRAASVASFFEFLDQQGVLLTAWSTQAISTSRPVSVSTITHPPGDKVLPEEPVEGSHDFGLRHVPVQPADHLSLDTRRTSRDPHHLRLERPEDESAFIIKAIEKDREKRYRSAVDMGADLRSLRRFS